MPAKTKAKPKAKTKAKTTGARPGYRAVQHKAYSYTTARGKKVTVPAHVEYIKIKK